MNYFLLCAYNESKNITEVIKSIKENFKHENKIVIVNDGSSDDTEIQIRKCLQKYKDIILLTHKKNLGLGKALKTGFMFILKSRMKDEDTIITLDADNTHPVEIANLMMEKFLMGYDLVIASRFVKNAKQQGVPFFRKLLSLMARFIFKYFFYHPLVKDYTSGYRLYGGKILNRAYAYYRENLIKEKDFVVQLEILIKLLKFKPKVYEVPIDIKYFLKYGKSKLKIVKNIISYLNFIITYFAKNL
ncbi:MAG: glycosyltransferase family 2 protein [Endomicrobiia bacterium]